MLNIVFGSVKTNTRNSLIQEFDYPSIKIEASKGAKTSRRVLFNKPACDLLGLEEGDAQVLLFGFAEADENGTNRLFVVNTNQFPKEVEEKVYKTSRNKVTYTDSTEKGKAISSKPLVEEIINFLGINGDIDNDFTLSIYQSHEDDTEVDLYEIALGSEDNPPKSNHLDDLDLENDPVDNAQVDDTQDLGNKPELNEELGVRAEAEQEKRSFNID